MKLTLPKILSLVFLGSFLIGCVPLNINTNPYWQGKIQLTDGSVKEGFIMVPNNTRENRIAFKNSANGEKESVKRKDIEKVVVVSNTGNSYLYENVPASMTIKGKSTIGKSLLLVVGKNDYVTFYVESEAYSAHKDSGKITIIDRYEVTKDLPLFTYYIRKTGVEHANMIAMTGSGGWIGFNAKLKKSAKHHLAEDANLVKQIEDGELKHKDIRQIIEQYIKTTNQKASISAAN